MEVLLAGAVIAAVLYAMRKPQPGSSSSGSASSSSTTPAAGSGSAPRPPALSPGVYPAGTPGAIPVVLYVKGGDGGVLTALPGGRLSSGQTRTVYYGPGTKVVFVASVDGFSPFTAFDHFDGPGVSTRQNPITQVVGSAGYVRAVFAFLGQVGQ